MKESRSYIPSCRKVAPRNYRANSLANVSIEIEETQLH